MLFVSTTFSVVLFYNAGVEKIDFLIISEADLCCYLIVCMNAEAKFQLIKEKCCPSVELLVCCSFTYARMKTIIGVILGNRHFIYI